MKTSKLVFSTAAALFLMIVPSFISPSLAESAESDRYYGQIFDDDRFDVTLALGFEQIKTSKGFPIIGPFLKTMKRDEVNTIEDVTRVDKAILGCVECGFRLERSSDGERLYFAQSVYKGRLVEVRLRFIFPLGDMTAQRMRAAFIKALGRDDLIMYIGHARGGRGFPDFGAPTSDVGMVFVNDVVSGWTGFEKGYFSRSKYQILSIHACGTAGYFKDVTRQRVWEKDPSKLALLMTSGDSWFHDYPATSIALIRALMLGLDRAQVLQEIELAANDYYLRQRDKSPVIPLFIADGFFDKKYDNYLKNKRKFPISGWREFPF